MPNAWRSRRLGGPAGSLERTSPSAKVKRRHVPIRNGIVYRQAKRAFKTVLDIATSPAYRVRDQPRLLEFDGCNDALPAVLAEALETNDDREHLLAAWKTVAGARWTPRLIRKPQLKRADSIVSTEPRRRRWRSSQARFSAPIRERSPTTALTFDQRARLSSQASPDLGF